MQTAMETNREKCDARTARAIADLNSNAPSARQVLLPEARTFGDIFARARLYKTANSADNLPAYTWRFQDVQFPKTKRGKTRILQTYCTVGSYCQVTNRATSEAQYVPALSVEPNRRTLETVKRHFLAIEYNSIYFDVILHGDGVAAVYAHHNVIIGSRLLAFIDADTVPGSPSFDWTAPAPRVAPLARIATGAPLAYDSRARLELFATVCDHIAGRLTPCKMLDAATPCGMAICPDCRELYIIAEGHARPARCREYVAMLQD